MCEILAPRDSRLTWRRAQVLVTATLAIRSPSYKPHKREERESSAREIRAPAGFNVVSGEVAPRGGLESTLAVVLYLSTTSFVSTFCRVNRTE